MNIGNGTRCRRSYDGTLIGNHVWPIEWYKYQWPWVSLKVIFVVWNISNTKTSWNIAHIEHVYSPNKAITQIDILYALLLLHPFNGLFSRTTWISRHQKGKSLWILMMQEMMGGSGISWTICRSFALRSREICQYIPHHCIGLLYTVECNMHGKHCLA